MTIEIFGLERKTLAAKVSKELLFSPGAFAAARNGTADSGRSCFNGLFRPFPAGDFNAKTAARCKDTGGSFEFSAYLKRRLYFTLSIARSPMETLSR